MKRINKLSKQLVWLVFFIFVLLFILLAVFGSPYQTWDYSDPEWTVIGTLWHSFEWVFFKVAPIAVIVITSILGIIFVKRNK